MTSFGHGKLLSSIHENSPSIHNNTELLSKSTISNKNNSNNRENNYDVNFVSIQNSLNNSLISPDECVSPGSVYHLITSLSPTHVTQTTPAIAMTTTTDYKQYGCNAQKVNHKLNHLNSTVNRNDHDTVNLPMILQKTNEHNISINKFDDYQTLDYLGLVSPTVLNKQSVYHKNLGLVTYSPHIMNMPKLISLPSGGQITFNQQNTICSENKKLFTSVHHNPVLDNSSYQITHYHTQSQPQPMNNRYTTLPTFSYGNQTICDINSTFTTTYNQHHNHITTYNKSNNNTVLPYLVMTTSNINLNNLNYSNKNNKYPKQSYTYYDIRQPDLKVNIPVMYKSKSQQLSTASKYHIPFDNSIKDNDVMESSNVWKNEEQLPHTTENINRSSNNNDNNCVRGEDISKLCNKTKIWTPDEPNTPLENWVALREQNSHGCNNNTFTSSVSLTANSDNIIPTIDNTVVNVTYANNKCNSNTTSKNQSSHIGRQQNLADSGKYMSAALRESSFV
ncbi:hypothetical protein MN116_008902 [Schistosoma mekongi]|uniref:Uncharacterized protein n=1 Tax=Schistosoma mekongi TaxID=38744 RepID=A0AAE1Z4D5_SCHME|nr:hypothetical protein MN116_008902 [Schistosoma mekongi]